jgi:hypothetical protein
MIASYDIENELIPPTLKEVREPGNKDQFDQFEAH